MLINISHIVDNKKIKNYEVHEIKEAVIEAGVLPKVTDNKKITYYNAPISFDIETTSFEVQRVGQKKLEKVAIMYIWKLCINGVIVRGRTWDEFVEVYEFLVEWFSTNFNRRLVIYIHNLAFEFQFIRKWFEWEEVFSLDKREPIRALTIDGIEFRCSLKLSGYSLSKLSSQLLKYKVQKLVGDLDYSLLRNSKTILTEQEERYCDNDVLVVVCYIQEYIEKVEYIYNIPMTKTGVVRNFTRNYCFYNNGKRKENYNTYKAYRCYIRQLTLTKDSYIPLRRAFAGGFTHANCHYVGEILKNVKSQDFTSSYPYVMVAEKFPCSKPEFLELQDERQFRRVINNCCCFFDIEFEGIESNFYYENYISESHCLLLQNQVVNNGRIVSADRLITTITEQDFLIIEYFYNWKSCRIRNFYYMKKNYLPKNYVRAILDIYKSKTELKDVVGREADYLNSKELLNSLYGMTVTDICRDTILYADNEWGHETPDLTKAIQSNNTSLKRFLYYPWGVWVTAYARFNLFTAIKELGDDYVYSDTDSVKYINYDKHIQYFDNYNKGVEEKLRIACAYHKIDYEMTRPKTIEGKIKQLGVWDDEGIYTRFKTLGAKRYMTEKKGVISITVAGLNKHKAVPYMLDKFGDNIFERFDDELYVPPDKTGKLTHTYIDEEQKGLLTDYQGNTAEYYEKSSIHLSPADYSLSLNDKFIKYIKGVKDVYS